MFKDISNHSNLKITRLLEKFTDKFECERTIRTIPAKLFDQI